MILAVAILLFNIPPAISNTGGTTAAGTIAQQAAASETSSAQSTQQTSGSETQEPAKPEPAKDQAPVPATPSKGKTSPQKSTRSKKRVQKKPLAVSECDNSITGTPGTSMANAAGATPQTSSPTSTEVSAPAAKNCPPEKIIVRHGGTAEPSIQLAGGDQGSNKRDAAKEMLGSTEANLKKISSIQLSPAQQDSVSQIRQFVVQSKAALAAGDLERGHTLAWKAQLLSEDLVNPQK